MGGAHFGKALTRWSAPLIPAGVTDDGPDLRWNCDRVFRGVRAARGARREEGGMSVAEILGGALAAGVLVYLFIALLKPEIFS
jgi:K+-transporting ATPase KdpF subunit